LNDLEEKILSILDANGGETDWVTLMAGLDYREQQETPVLLRDMKKRGIAQKQNRKVDGKLVLHVFRLSGGE